MENKIVELAVKNNLPRAQVNELKTMFYTGETNTPHAATLEPMLAEILKEATASAQETFGFPDGFNPPKDGPPIMLF